MSKYFVAYFNSLLIVLMFTFEYFIEEKTTSEMKYAKNTFMLTAELYLCIHTEFSLLQKVF